MDPLTIGMLMAGGGSLLGAFNQDNSNDANAKAQARQLALINQLGMGMMSNRQSPYEQQMMRMLGGMRPNMPFNMNQSQMYGAQGMMRPPQGGMGGGQGYGGGGGGWNGGGGVGGGMGGWQGGGGGGSNPGTGYPGGGRMPTDMFGGGMGGGMDREAELLRRMGGGGMGMGMGMGMGGSGIGDAGYKGGQDMDLMNMLMSGGMGQPAGGQKTSNRPGSRSDPNPDYSGMLGGPAKAQQGGDEMMAFGGQRMNANSQAAPTQGAAPAGGGYWDTPEGKAIWDKTFKMGLLPGGENDATNSRREVQRVAAGPMPTGSDIYGQIARGRWEIARKRREAAGKMEDAITTADPSQYGTGVNQDWSQPPTGPGFDQLGMGFGGEGMGGGQQFDQMGLPQAMGSEVDISGIGGSRGFNTGQDAMMQMLRSDPLTQSNANVEQPLNELMRNGGRSGLNDVFATMDPIEQRSMTQGLNQLRAGTSGLGQRLGTAQQSREADMITQMTEQSNARKAGMTYDNSNQSFARQLQALGMGGQNMLGMNQGRLGEFGARSGAAQGLGNMGMGLEQLLLQGQQGNQQANNQMGQFNANMGYNAQMANQAAMQQYQAMMQQGMGFGQNAYQNNRGMNAQLLSLMAGLPMGGGQQASAMPGAMGGIGEMMMLYPMLQGLLGGGRSGGAQ